MHIHQERETEMHAVTGANGVTLKPAKGLRFGRAALEQKIRRG